MPSHSSDVIILDADTHNSELLPSTRPPREGGDDSERGRLSTSSSICDRSDRNAPKDPLSQAFYYAGSSRSCLSCFFVLRLEPGVRGQQEQMRVLWTHPYTEVEARVKYPNMSMFLVANNSTSYSAEHLTFTFVLTDSRGIREYGHTTTFVNGEAVVALSPYPWSNFFYSLASLYRSNGSRESQRIVRAMCSCGTPPSGATFLTPLDLGVSFTRPYDRLCSFIDTTPVDLLRIFPHTDTLFSVLADLLLEKHVIVVGPNYSLVSTVIMSLQALIAPFDWMHILIPVLPDKLIDVLAAPPPYLVGMLTSQVPLMKQVCVDSVVMVHLGFNGVCEKVRYINETVDVLPHSGTFSAFRVGLSILRLRDPRDQTVRDLCSLFLSYYATLFGEVVLRGARDYRSTARHRALTRAHAQFFARLLSTQSFSVLSEEVKKVLSADSVEWMDNEFIVAAVRAHPNVFPRHFSELAQEEKEGGGFLERYHDCFGSRETFTSFTAAVHGFGGHRFSITRTLLHCVGASCCCFWNAGSGEGGGDSGAYSRGNSSGVNYGGSVGAAIVRHTYRSARGDTPTVVNEEMFVAKSLQASGQCSSNGLTA